MVNVELLADKVRKRNFQFSRKQIDEWIENWREEHGENPNKTSGPVSPAASIISWADVDTALLLGFGELEGGSSLEHTLCENGDQNTAPALSERLLLYHMLKHSLHNENAMPDRNSGEIVGLYNENWEKGFLALRRGSRQLPRKLSVDEFLTKYGLKFNGLDEELIVGLARNHNTFRDKHGMNDALPNRKTPIILDENGEPIDVLCESWEGLYCASYQGLRGLTKGQYLNDIYLKHGLILGELSNESILREVITHLREKREFPNENSGMVNGFIGEKWHAMDSALRNCRRGITEKSSLPRLIKKFVLDQADKHKITHDTYPTRTCGYLPDYSDIEWSLIESSLPNRGTNVRPENKKTLEQFLTENGRIMGAPASKLIDLSFS